jgi:hypothetical protein
MDAELMEKARAGLQGWQDGDLTALEELLDPNVELLWWEPGEWDCTAATTCSNSSRNDEEKASIAPRSS